MSGHSESILDLLESKSRSHWLRQDSARTQPERTEPGNDVENEYSAFGQSRIGNRPQMMLAFRKSSGEVFVFAYSLLTRLHSLNPDLGFTVNFTDATVIIEGTGLTPLFRSISQHRTAEVVEADRTQIFTAGGTSDCVVTQLLVQPQPRQSANF